MKEDVLQSMRNRIWNVFYSNIFIKIDSPLNFSFTPAPVREFTLCIFDNFFKKDLAGIYNLSAQELIDYIKRLFLELKWYEVYDFIDFFSEFYPKDVMVNKKTVLQKIKQVLEQERTAYRIVGGNVTPLTSEEEIKEIEKALNIPDKYKPVQEHFSKALEKWADRKKPDYANSIGESIKAVESLVEILLGKKGTLGKLIDKLDIHPAMKEGFSNLYGWTSDEGGVRHGKYKEPLSCDEPEARYMLITCSAFINYVISKFSIIPSKKIGV